MVVGYHHFRKPPYTHIPGSSSRDPRLDAFKGDLFRAENVTESINPGHVLKKPVDVDPQVRHEKNPYSFPLYWLVFTDPYNGLL